MSHYIFYILAVSHDTHFKYSGRETVSLNNEVRKMLIKFTGYDFASKLHILYNTLFLL